MYKESDFIGRPVASLQYMLRQISFLHDVIPRLSVDGLFGPETLEALMIFQREFFPPVTGVVDLAVWEAVVAQYHIARRALDPPRTVSGPPHAAWSAAEGDSSLHLMMSQSMFRALSRVLEDIEEDEITGRHGEASARNTRWLQERAGLERTGVFGKAEWEALARLYDSFIRRDPEVP